MASADDFIRSLPNAYDTQIGVGGCLLSGGQKARIAIARALIKDPLVLILDEATAALDNQCEQEVIDVLINLRKSKTIVIFTHSDQMKSIADVTYQIENGDVINLYN